jgi:hypothetical protein
MEVPEYIILILVFYFIIVTMIVIGAISKYDITSEKRKTDEIFQLIRDTNLGIILGVVSGAFVVVYYNWMSCVFFEDCPLTGKMNFFNNYTPMMVVGASIIIIVLLIINIIGWILRHKK